MLKIFVEGRDLEFLECLIKKRLGKQNGTDFEIIQTGGWKKLENLKPKLQEFIDNEHTLLIIFDADYPEIGGYDKRLLYLQNFKVDNNFEFEVFLFPNDASNGTLEVLLEKVVNPKHQKVIDCFSNYENCLKQYKDGENYQLPIQKSKIYAYVDAFQKSRKENEKFKKGNFSFENENIWNLNSPYLEPLINIISKHI